MGDLSFDRLTTNVTSAVSPRGSDATADLGIAYQRRVAELLRKPVSSSEASSLMVSQAADGCWKEFDYAQDIASGRQGG